MFPFIHLSISEGKVSRRGSRRRGRCQKGIFHAPSERNTGSEVWNVQRV